MFFSRPNTTSKTFQRHDLLQLTAPKLNRTELSKQIHETTLMLCWVAVVASVRTIREQKFKKKMKKRDQRRSKVQDKLMHSVSDAYLFDRLSQKLLISSKIASTFVLMNSKNTLIYIWYGYKPFL